MGTTLSHLGPQLGQAAGGFVQGRQLRTQEDETRQGMALRAAEEGRAKESHRLNIQQLGLAIQGMQQAQEHASKLFPGQLESQQQGLYGGRPTAPGAERGLEQAVPGFDADPNTPYSANLDIAQLMGQGQRAATVAGGREDRIGLDREKLIASMASTRVVEAEKQYRAAETEWSKTKATADNFMSDPEARKQAKSALKTKEAEMIRKRRAFEKASREAASLGVEYATEGTMSQTVEPAGGSSALGSYNEED